MNLKWTWLVGIILLTNLLTFTIVKVYFPTAINNNYYLLKMKGQGEHWNIKDYQFAWVPNKGAVHGSETVTYLGNPNELKGNIVVEIYDFFEDGTVPHQTSSIEVRNLKDGTFKAGGGGAYPDEDLSVKDIVQRTFFLIRWTTKDGEQHEETIQMVLDYDPQILSHIE